MSVLALVISTVSGTDEFDSRLVSFSRGMLNGTDTISFICIVMSGGMTTFHSAAALANSTSPIMYIAPIILCKEIKIRVNKSVAQRIILNNVFFWTENFYSFAIHLCKQPFNLEQKLWSKNSDECQSDIARKENKIDYVHKIR